MGWTRDNQTRKHPRDQAAFMLYERAQKRPFSVSLVPANVNEIRSVVSITIDSGAVYVFDKGYLRFSTVVLKSTSRVLCVHRFKKNTL